MNKLIRWVVQQEIKDDRYTDWFTVCQIVVAVEMLRSLYQVLKEGDNG